MRLFFQFDRFWTGPSQLETMDASEIYSKRHNAKELVFTKEFFCERAGSAVSNSKQAQDYRGSADNTSARDGVSPSDGRSVLADSSIMDAAKETAHTVLNILVHLLSHARAA